MNIPSRFRENHFASVAHIIGAACASYPKPVRVNPKPLMAETLARKLREAIIAKQLYNHKHPLIDEAHFKEYADKLQVGTKNVGELLFVLIGAKELLSDNKINVAGELEHSTPHVVSELDFTFTRITDLENLCTMLHEGMFKPRPVVNVTAGGLTPELITSLEERYNVGFVPLNGRLGTWQIV